MTTDKKTEMPGAVPRTSSYALNNATLPYGLALADKGLGALRDPHLLGGKCGGCAFSSTCGGCRARAYALTGDLLAEEPDCAYPAN